MYIKYIYKCITVEKLILNLGMACVWFWFKSIELNFKETLETIGMKDKMFNERESGKN